jgi:hypothetical protein
MSFIEVDSSSDFSYQNLPYGIFSTENDVSIHLISYFFCFDYLKKKIFFVCFKILIFNFFLFKNKEY